MNESECLSRMVAPGTRRPGKYRQGVIQIHITRACDKSCFGCTQGSNLAGRITFIKMDNFEKAVLSLKGYYGVVGIFGGNPALHPQFGTICEILKKHIPYEQRGLWCNNPLGKGPLMRETFNPKVSNLNVHMDHKAYNSFKDDWSECGPVGLMQDSRHSPPFVAMKDVEPDESKRWEMISDCDINQYWSAMMAEFRGELRAWFCEIAGAQSILHQDNPNYPDTGLDPTVGYEHFTAPGDRIETTVGKWWQLPMDSFAHQVRKHCHECGIPLRGYGELAQSTTGSEQVSETHKDIYKPKDRGRRVELVTVREQLSEGKISSVVRYLQNSGV